MKIISIIIISSLCVYSGFTFSRSIKKRKSELESLCDSFEELLRCIKYKPKSCKEAVICVADVTANPVFTLLSEAADDKIVYAYTSSESILKSRMYLSDTDWNILNKYFLSFGKRSSEEEIECCEKTIAYLRQRYDSASEDVKKYADLWMKSGVLAGFLIAILLI